MVLLVIRRAGWLSIDPAVFFTLPLVMLFAGIRSERRRCASASFVLAQR